MTAHISWIFWLYFCTDEGSRNASSTPINISVSVGRERLSSVPKNISFGQNHSIWKPLHDQPPCFSDVFSRNWFLFQHNLWSLYNAVSLHSTFWQRSYQNEQLLLSGLKGRSSRTQRALFEWDCSYLSPSKSAQIPTQPCTLTQTHTHTNQT